MASPERLMPFAQRQRSDTTLRHDLESDLSEQSGPMSYTSRHGSSIPRIASLDFLVSGKMAGTICPSVKSEYSPTSSVWPSPFPVGPNDGVFFQHRDIAERSASLDHMINTLHHVMMTKDVLDPVPVEHNSCILHLLEGYWKLQERLRNTEQALAEERVTKRHSLEEFIKMSTEWEQKEANFLAEIKRLELLLAEVSPGGVGAVVVARSGSVVDRSARCSKLFKARVEQARSPKKAQDPGDSAFSNNPDHCIMLESPRRTHQTLLSMHPVLAGNADAELSDKLRRAPRRRNIKKEHLEPQDSHIEAKAVQTLKGGAKQDQSPKGRAPKSIESPRQATLTPPEGLHPPSRPALLTPDLSLHQQPLCTVDKQTESTFQATANALDTPGGDHLGVQSATYGESRHKREFSFDTGEDNIPLLPFVSLTMEDNWPAGNCPNRSTSLGSEEKIASPRSSNLVYHERGNLPGDEGARPGTMESVQPQHHGSCLAKSLGESPADF